MTAKAHPVALGELVFFHEPVPEGQPDPDPEVAIVCRVNEDGSVNLCAFTPTGTSRPVHAVPVFKAGGKVGPGGYCCPMTAPKEESHAKEAHAKESVEPHAKAPTHAPTHGKGHGHK